jgi:hypothetical protein
VRHITAKKTKVSIAGHMCIVFTSRKKNNLQKIDFYRKPAGSGFGVPEPVIEQQENMNQKIIEGLHTIRCPLIIIAYSYGAA